MLLVNNNSHGETKEDASTKRATIELQQKQDDNVTILETIPLYDGYTTSRTSRTS